MRTLIAAMFLAALLAACQSTAPQTAPDVPSARNIRATVAYNCDSGVAFTAAFLVSPDAVDLHYPDGKVVRLEHAVSGSGFRYKDKTHEFQGKADEALYTIGGGAPTKCYVSK
jgi:membrane-bound inhibitor of C-type lysozyme